jgi:hypothetical protein
MLTISRSVFVDQNDWNKHDPLVLLKRYSSSLRSRFFVSVGWADGYGFQEGSEKFYVLAKARSFFSKWLPVPEGHCNFSRKGTAKFIMGDRL